MKSFINTGRILLFLCTLSVILLCGCTLPFSKLKHREYTTLAEKYQFGELC